MTRLADTVLDAETVAIEASRATAQSISRRFHVPVWYGVATRHYWAMIPGPGPRLLEAERPADLADQLRRAWGCGP
jgi:hypothetical protein